MWYFHNNRVIIYEIEKRENAKFVRGARAKGALGVTKCVFSHQRAIVHILAAQ